MEPTKQGISLHPTGSSTTESNASAVSAQTSPDLRFDELLWEARRSDKWGEHRRALDLYQRALAEAPEDISSEDLAEVVEAMGRLRAALAECAERATRLESDLVASRHNPERRFSLGTVLLSLGRGEEAIQHLRAALPFAESMLACCRADLFWATGWYHFRRGEHQAALKWFERATTVKLDDSFQGPAVHRATLLSLLLVYAELGEETEAREIVLNYIERYGRVPWPESRALRKLNIDADAMFIKHVNGFV